MRPPMGASQATEMAEASPPTPTDETLRRRRELLLQRLGIQNKGDPLPTKAVEAPDRMEHVPEKDDERGKDFDLNFMQAGSQDDFRVNFLRKLSYNKVWVPQAQHPPKHQTVTIFDWDDTLLCTSFLTMRDDHALPPGTEQHLKTIETHAQRLLELAMRLGHTFIITNAMEGWVEQSCATWLPGLLPTLQRVRIISARTKFECHYPGDVSKWKIQAFLEVQKQLDSQIITNLLSLGDSNFEMDAVHVMGQEFAQALVKTIKFRERPFPQELAKQLELVCQKFEKIVNNGRNLKVGLERK